MLAAGTQLKPWLDILYRRRYLVLIPALVGLVGGVVVLSQLPRLYLARTTILVTPQRVPENFVQTTVTSRLEDRVTTLSVQVISRQYLETIAREFGLIGQKADDREIEAAVGELQSHIFPTIDPARPPKYFQIQVENQDPKLAAGVANRLGELFIQQNTTLRQGQASAALATAEKWLAQTKAKLDTKEAEVAKYKQSRLWEMPEQFPANMQLLQATQQRIQTIASDIQNRATQIGSLRMSAQSVPALPAVTSVPAVDPATAHYLQLQRELQDLQLKYTDDFPDVVRKRDEVATWVKLNPQVTSPPGTGGATSGRPSGPTAIDVQVARLEAEIRNLEGERAKLEAQIGTYQARITSSPGRAQEVEQLTRDLATLRNDYNAWLQKAAEARRALDMEVDQQGEQFQIQDAASVPAVPYKPKPMVVILMGLFIGLGAGVAGSLLLEFMDNTVRTEEEFATAFPELTLLATIPDLDRSARKRRKRRGPARRKVAAVGLVMGALLGSLHDLLFFR